MLPIDDVHIPIGAAQRFVVDSHALGSFEDAVRPSLLKPTWHGIVHVCSSFAGLRQFTPQPHAKQKFPDPSNLSTRSLSNCLDIHIARPSSATPWVRELSRFVPHSPNCVGGRGGGPHQPQARKPARKRSHDRQPKPTSTHQPIPSSREPTRRRPAHGQHKTAAGTQPTAAEEQEASQTRPNSRRTETEGAPIARGHPCGHSPSRGTEDLNRRAAAAFAAAVGPSA